MKIKALALLGSLAFLSCKEVEQNAKKIAVITHKELKNATTAAGSIGKLKPINTHELSSEETRKLFIKNDIKSLFFQSEEEIYSSLNGFFGSDNYRIEFVFLGIEQDPIQKNKFYVYGKNKHKKIITKFEGFFEIDKVSLISDPNIKDTDFESEYESFDELKEKYACTGTFNLKEDSTQKYSGIFSGKMALDFGINSDNKPEIWYYSNKTPAKSSGFLFEGDWVNNESGDKKPFVFSKDIFMFANDIMKDFSYGEREIEINPKYRKLGWADFWQSNEWWIDAKKEM